MTKSTASARTKKPKKTDRTLLVFVLDRSGSMSVCLSSTISGFNEFLLQQQQENTDRAFMTLVKFNTDLAGGPSGVMLERTYTAAPIEAVAQLGTLENPYIPAGGTPLLDAVGTTIVATDAVASEYDHVLFVIQTDGEENSSREYTRDSLFKLVTERRAKGWDFVFMGADIDAYSAAQSMNIPVTNTMAYVSGASHAAFASVSSSIASYRRSGGATKGALVDDWAPQVAKGGAKCG